MLHMLHHVHPWQCQRDPCLWSTCEPRHGAAACATPLSIWRQQCNRSQRRVFCYFHMTASDVTLQYGCCRLCTRWQRMLGTGWLRGRSLWQLGSALSDQGHFKDAEVPLREALTVLGRGARG